jgi:hypothetical protein
VRDIVRDAPPHIKDQQLKMLMPVLRDKPMRTYSKVIVQEVEEAIKNWGESGEVDFPKSNICPIIGFAPGILGGVFFADDCC